MDLATLLVELWRIIFESAPALLLGFGIAGLISSAIPQRVILTQLSRPGLLSVAKSSAAGIPLPLCSCSVIPVGIGLRRGGASRGATASFLISTPEIGVDSFLLSYVLLGPLIACARVATAFVSALTVGYLIDRQGEDRPAVAPLPLHSCCNHSPVPSKSSVLKSAVRFGFLDLFKDLAPLLLLGFFLSAVVSTAVPEDFFLSLNLPPWILLVTALLVSLPIYICASSSTPLAAALIDKGLSAGAGLVFLCAGPASNVATILAVKKELGNRALAIYLVGISVVTIAFGAVLNVIVARYPELISLQIRGGEHEHNDPLRVAFGIIFLGLLALGLYRNVSARSHRATESCCSE